MMRNTTTEFGSLSKILHWLMAVIIFSLIIVGIYMADLPRVTDDEKQFAFQLYATHKSLGIVIMFLVVIRLIWHKVSPNPPLPAVFVGKERLLIEGTKKLLYFMMLLLPISGYLMSNAHGHPIEFFALFKFPILINKSETYYRLLHGIHVIGGWLMLLVVLAHVAGALKHRLENEGTAKDILQRML